MNSEFVWPPRIQYKLDEYTVCCCCDEHQIDKPPVWEPRDACLVRTTSVGRRCKCNCRHLARAICRQHPLSCSGLSQQDRLIVLSQIVDQPGYEQSIQNVDIGERQLRGMSGVWG